MSDAVKKLIDLRAGYEALPADALAQRIRDSKAVEAEAIIAHGREAQTEWLLRQALSEDAVVKVTPTRARELLGRMQYGEFPMAYRRPCDSPTRAIDPTGITQAEDRYVRAFWESLPGHTTYFDAMQRIASGKGRRDP